MKPTENITVIPKAPAYWISPYSQILPITGDEKHIEQVIKNPEAFVFTMHEIQAMYDTEGEELGVEGIAREKIIKICLERGWIRIRYYQREDYFTVNVFVLNEIAKNFIYQWAVSLAKQGHSYSNAIIDTPDKRIQLSLHDIISNESFPHTDSPILKTVNSADELLCQL